MSGFSKLAVVGGGAFGVALGKLAAIKSSEVVIWARDQNICDGINQNHFHKTKLPEVILPANVSATSDLAKALAEAQAVILALPMTAMGEVLTKARAFLPADAILVSCAKGISTDNLQFACDIIEGLVPQPLAKRACYLSGPAFASELARNLPSAMTLASADKNAASTFQRAFSTEHCRLYLSDDVMGVCVGGALKNVIAIAAGACATLNLGHNALAALITRGLREMTRLAVVLGGQPETMSGLAGVGDLILSCTTNMSRNYQLGMLLALGLDVEAALRKIGSVVEGAQSARAIVTLMKKYQIEMPISHAVYRVIYENQAPHQAISSLLARTLKDEKW